MKKLPLFDTHAHVDVEDFDADREELLRAIGETMAGIIDPGCDIPSSKMALRLAHQYPFVWAAVGIHPEEIGHSSLEDLDQIEAWCADPRVVAIGEIGLDYYNDEHSPHGLQQEFLIRQLDLARKTGLPVIIHDRESHEDVLRIIREEGKDVRGVLHCFSGDWAMAEEALALAGTWGSGAPAPSRTTGGCGPSWPGCQKRGSSSRPIPPTWRRCPTGGSGTTPSTPPSWRNGRRNSGAPHRKKSWKVQQIMQKSCFSG